MPAGYRTRTRKARRRAKRQRWQLIGLYVLAPIVAVGAVVGAYFMARALTSADPADPQLGRLELIVVGGTAPGATAGLALRDPVGGGYRFYTVPRALLLEGPQGEYIMAGDEMGHPTLRRDPGALVGVPVGQELRLTYGQLRRLAGGGVLLVRFTEPAKLRVKGVWRTYEGSVDLPASQIGSLLAAEGASGEDEDVAAQYRQTSRPFLEAVLLLQEGKADEAAASFEQLLAREGATPLLQLELGRALLFRGGATDAAQAVEHLRTWVTQHPDDFGASTSLAEALRQAERPDEATELLFQIAERAPRASLALQHLAEHLVTLGNWAEAAEACEEGLRHRPRSAELKQLLGLSLHGLGRHAEAVKLLEAVLRERWRLNPETGEVEFDRATAAVLIRIYLAAQELNQAERAADLLGAMEREAPEAELPGIHLATAEALLRLGRTEEAKRRVTLARSLAADDPTIEQRAARLFAPTPS